MQILPVEKGGYLTKMRIETEMSESLTLWQTTIEIMKPKSIQGVGNSRKSVETETA